MTAAIGLETRIHRQRKGAPDKQEPLRILPVPDSGPPFDDECCEHGPAARARASGGVQGALALDFRMPNGLPCVPEAQLFLIDDVAARQLRRRNASPDSGDDADTWAARQTTGAAKLPEPRRWVARLVQGALEVLTGDRPAQQLAPWTDPGLQADLAARSRAVLRRPRPQTRARILVRSVHVCEPVDGVVEATAVVQLGERCRAVAVRLESLDKRWRATLLRVI